MKPTLRFNVLILFVLMLAIPFARGVTVSIRTAPRPLGNYYPITPETAPYTLKTDWLPTHWITPTNRYVLWQGPVMTTDYSAPQKLDRWFRW